MRTIVRSTAQSTRFRTCREQPLPHDTQDARRRDVRPTCISRPHDDRHSRHARDWTIDPQGTRNRNAFRDHARLRAGDDPRSHMRFVIGSRYADKLR